MWVLKKFLELARGRITSTMPRETRAVVDTRSVGIPVRPAPAAALSGKRPLSVRSDLSNAVPRPAGKVGASASNNNSRSALVAAPPPPPATFICDECASRNVLLAQRVQVLASTVDLVRHAVVDSGVFKHDHEAAIFAAVEKILSAPQPNVPSSRTQ